MYSCLLLSTKTRTRKSYLHRQRGLQLCRLCYLPFVPRVALELRWRQTSIEQRCKYLRTLTSFTITVQCQRHTVKKNPDKMAKRQTNYLTHCNYSLHNSRKWVFVNKTNDSSLAHLRWYFDYLKFWVSMTTRLNTNRVVSNNSLEAAKSKKAVKYASIKRFLRIYSLNVIFL